VESFVYLAVSQRGSGSMIISPQGKVLAEGQGPDDIAIADINPFGGREGGEAAALGRPRFVCLLGNPAVAFQVAPFDSAARHGLCTVASLTSPAAFLLSPLARPLSGLIRFGPHPGATHAATADRPLSLPLR